MRRILFLVFSCFTALLLAQYSVPSSLGNLDASLYLTFDEGVGLPSNVGGVNIVEGTREVTVKDGVDYTIPALPNAIVLDGEDSALFLDYEGYLSLEDTLINRESFTVIADYRWTANDLTWIGFMSMVGKDPASGNYVSNQMYMATYGVLTGFGLPNITFSKNTEYQVAITYSSGSLAFYLDGELMGTSTTVAALNTYEDLRIQLGARNRIDATTGVCNPVVDANGKCKNTRSYVDNVAVFKRVLSAAEIKAVSDGGLGFDYEECGASVQDFEDAEMEGWTDISGNNKVGVEEMDGSQMLYVDYVTSPKTTAAKVFESAIVSNEVNLSFDVRSERSYVNVLISLFDDSDQLITVLGVCNSGQKNFIVYKENPTCYNNSCAEYAVGSDFTFVGNATYGLTLNLNLEDQVVSLAVDGKRLEAAQLVPFIQAAQNLKRIEIRNEYFYANTKKFYVDNFRITELDKSDLLYAVTDNLDYLEHLDEDYRLIDYSAEDLQAFNDTLDNAKLLLGSCGSEVTGATLAQSLEAVNSARAHFDTQLKVLNVPTVFNNNMVIQRDRLVTIWGWADDSKTVSFSADWSDGINASTTADADGYFEFKVMTPSAGGPYTFSISDGELTKTISDVMSGDVYLVTGQSNMDRGLGDLDNTAEEVANADYPNLRLYIQPKSYLAKESTEVNPNLILDDDVALIGHPALAGWTACSPATVELFSATGYMFGRTLTQQEPNVPIGLVEIDKGGSNIQTWIQSDYLLRMNGYAKNINGFADGSITVSGYNNPTVAYNGMMAPVTQLQVAGAIWYQGESNASKPEEYRALLPLLIDCWRDNFEQDFPFYIVQLAAYKGAYQELRESQYLTHLNVKNTGIVNTIDIGSYSQIHPPNKQETGRRLALWALQDVYDEDVAATGPEYGDSRVDGNTIKVGFLPNPDNTLTLKSVSDNPFYISADGTTFVEADAEIVGDSLVISASGVTSPVEARYAFENFPEASLFNADGLPALPFRTSQPQYTQIYVEMVSTTSIRVRLFDAVKSLATNQIFVIDESGARITVTSANASEDGAVYTLSGDFNFTEGWIYFQSEFLTSGSPVALIASTDSYNAEITSLDLGGSTGTIYSDKAVVSVDKNETPANLVFSLSADAHSEMQSGVSVEELPVLMDVYSASGIRKRWTIKAKAIPSALSVVEVKSALSYLADNQWRYEGTNENSSFKVYNILGEIVSVGTTVGKVGIIDLQTQIPGLYFLYAQEGTTYRLLKQ